MPTLSYAHRYAIYGAAFGLCFPLLASLVAGYGAEGMLTGTGLWEMHTADPLLWIIDTAPLFLGLVAYLVGQRQDRLEQLNSFYEQVLASMPAQLAVFDRQKRFVYINPNTVTDPELRSWLIGKTDLDYCRRRGKDPQLAHRRMRRMEQVARDGEPYSFEETMIDRDGRERHFMRILSPVTDPSGAISHFLGYGLEITGRKQAEKAAEASAERYRTLMNLANDAIFIAEAKTGQLIDANQKAQELVGRSLEEICQMHQSELHPPEKREEYRAIFKQHMHDESVLAEGLQVVDREGRYTSVDISASTIEIDDTLLAHAIFRDATKREQYERQLVEAKERAEELLRLKSSILNNMSHELRTPLTSIIGFSDVLAKELPEEHREMVDLINRAGKRLQATLTSVLELSRLETNASLELESLEVGRQVRDVASLHEQQAQEKGLAFHVEEPETPLYARLDRGGLGRVVDNLLSNAIKFTRRGSVSVEVGTCGAGASSVYVKVEDTGVGISEEFLPHLFEDYKQESEGLSRSHEGSGLGLAITRRLVELMEGEIDVQSRKGQGSVFTVRFPRQKELEAEEGRLASSEELPENDDRARHARLLILEDTRANAEVMRRHLSSCKVDIAHTPQEALDLVQKYSYDLLLIDINLQSELSGTDVLKRTRRGVKNSTTPAVATTAYALPGDRKRFLKAGFDHYLSKPFSRRMLLKVVGEALSSAATSS